MRSFVRRLAVLALAPIAAVGVVAVASPANAAASTVSALQMESDIIAGTNAQRVKNGCGTLKPYASLIRAARGQSAYMAKSGRFSHIGRAGSTFDARIRAQGYSAPLAENIAYGRPTGAIVVTAWMNSPGHKANILNCKAKAIGVGVVLAANGTPYVTEDFGSK